MDERERRLMRLMECRSVGPSTLRKVLRHYAGPPPDSFFGQPPDWYLSTLGLPKIACQALSSISLATGLEATPEVHWLHLCSFLDSCYPAGLRLMPSSPPVLSVFGPFERLTSGKIAVLASRGAESEQPEAVKAAWRTAVEAGWTPVAGHNRGVYQWGLLAAKRCGGGAVMVLDRGLLAAFDDDLRRDPVPAARIWGFGFDAERSVAISPFRLRDPFIGRNNQVRDAMVAALADVIVAIGVREGGGMHRLCAEALRRGQTVLAAPDCLPLLADSGAREWTGTVPPPGNGQSATRCG